ncbi:hypothetical protein [Bernardetia sp.]|uniref:hypothetical protein n=1 Tax=Bernardetia sp. TaxID=1937974 RepID=UPI0025C4A559|nr:hypothetical protein [Bernardetia sp.]
MKPSILCSLLMLSFLFFTSCSKEEEKTTFKNKFEININGANYKSINEDIYGNENCDNIYVGASYANENGETLFHIRFQISKTGHLIEARYEEYATLSKNSNYINIFLTPNFNPLATFNISNFHYEPITEEVEFDFDGTVYYADDNSISRNISGSMQATSLKNIDCSVPNTGLEYFSSELNLFSFNNSASEYDNGLQLHRFFSNNGFRVYLSLSKDLWLQNSDEITFDENTSLDRVDFFETIGDLKADHFKHINEQDWKTYKTSGKIIIEEKYVEKGRNMVRGKLNILVKDNGKIIYNLNGIEFRTSSFE